MAAVFGGTVEKHMLGFSPFCFEQNLFTRIFWHTSESAAMCLLCWWVDVHVLFYFVPGEIHPKMDRCKWKNLTDTVGFFFQKKKKQEHFGGVLYSCIIAI